MGKNGRGGVFRAAPLYDRKARTPMNLRHVYGKTYVAEATTALIPIYKLNDRDVVLFDTAMPSLTAAA